MRKLHAFASLSFLLIVALACKRGADSSAADASAVVTSTPSIVTAADPASTTVSAPTNWKVGDTVDVEWSGSWYESQILAVLPGPQYKIHYVGWGNNYDETVGPSRMRARAGGSAPSSTAIATTSATTKAATTDTVDHVSKCPPNAEYAGAPYNACAKSCLDETDCSKPCVGDHIISSCSECPSGMKCIQVQHPMEDGVGWSKACVGNGGKGCTPGATTTAASNANASPYTAGCRAGWSRPHLEPGTPCMQECPNGSGTRESCPAGFVCQNSKVWVSPHCAKP